MPEEEIVLTELTEVREPDPASAALATDRLVLEDVRNVRFRVSADLGESTMKVRDILALRVGSVVGLNTMAGELTDIRVNGLKLARGEVVVINDTLHVRISEIIDSENESSGKIG